jgi:hypothetical protein
MKKALVLFSAILLLATVAVLLVAAALVNVGWWQLGAQVLGRDNSTFYIVMGIVCAVLYVLVRIFVLGRKR